MADPTKSGSRTPGYARPPVSANPVYVEKHHPKKHSAVRTDDYIYSQLIPYIGNKRRLLPLIARAVASTSCAGGTFVDLFTGSTVVARMAKTLGYRVVANDWEPYSFEIARGTVALNAPPAFERLGGAAHVFETLNSLAPMHGYIAQHLCPRSTESPDPETERMFFTRENGEQIDAMREQIAAWENEGRLTSAERAYVLAAFAYAVSYVSNTSGVFKGFHRGWGGSNGTALYRILSTISLKPPILCDNGEKNLAMREDAQRLAPRLGELLGQRPEIVYLDPPYNQHPYGSNYHVLNTVVLWDKPPLNPSIRVNGRKVEKSAIRKDWRTERKSPYNSAKDALLAFRALVEVIDARWILMSYSTEGNMAADAVLETLAARGDVRLVVNRYKRYRVSPTRPSAKSHNAEFVAVVDVDAPASTDRVSDLVEHVLAHEDAPSAADDQMALDVD